MSYQTSHYLKISDDGPDIAEVAAMLTEIASGKSPEDSGYGMCQHAWEFTLEGDPAKWHESTEHMTRVSERWPEVLFNLHGDGEDSEDLWVAYFRNGQMQMERRPA